MPKVLSFVFLVGLVLPVTDGNNRTFAYVHISNGVSELVMLLEA